MREFFLTGKDDDDGRLISVREEDEAGRKINRKDIIELMKNPYYIKKEAFSCEKFMYKFLKQES